MSSSWAAAPNCKCFRPYRKLCNQCFGWISHSKFLPLTSKKGIRRHALQRYTRGIALNAQWSPLEAEKSHMALQEVLYFLVQLECDSQLQRALNYVEYDTAQEIRNRRTNIDNILSGIQDDKAKRLDGSQISSAQKWEIGSEVLRLRGELQKAVDEERYADAATLRDKLAAAQAQLAGSSFGSNADNVQRRFVLGQRVLHRVHGYRGVVCGWDAACAEKEEWQVNAGVNNLSKGKAQPFYQVLVDSRDWPSSQTSRQTIDAPVTYVAEELLDAPEEPSCWLLEHGPDSFEHPFKYLLFLGTDERGNLIPARSLRERYSQPRADVFPPTDPGDAPFPPSGPGNAL
eukprot:jgi/Botrbrau1/22913/Bobra.0065s0062.1